MRIYKNKLIGRDAVKLIRKIIERVIPEKEIKQIKHISFNLYMPKRIRKGRFYSCEGQYFRREKKGEKTHIRLYMNPIYMQVLKANRLTNFYSAFWKELVLVLLHEFGHNHYCNITSYYIPKEFRKFSFSKSEKYAEYFANKNFREILRDKLMETPLYKELGLVYYRHEKYLHKVMSALKKYRNFKKAKKTLKLSYRRLMHYLQEARGLAVKKDFSTSDIMHLIKPSECYYEWNSAKVNQIISRNKLLKVARKKNIGRDYIDSAGRKHRFFDYKDLASITCNYDNLFQ